MIELKHLIGSADTTTEKGRAVPMPYASGLLARLKDAWAILKGNAYAIK